MPMRHQLLIRHRKSTPTIIRTIRHNINGRIHRVTIPYNHLLTTQLPINLSVHRRPIRLTIMYLSRSIRPNKQSHITSLANLTRLQHNSVQRQSSTKLTSRTTLSIMTVLTISIHLNYNRNSIKRLSSNRLQFTRKLPIQIRHIRPNRLRLGTNSITIRRMVRRIRIISRHIISSIINTMMTHKYLHIMIARTNRRRNTSLSITSRNLRHIRTIIFSNLLHITRRNIMCTSSLHITTLIHSPARIITTRNTTSSRASVSRN